LLYQRISVTGKDSDQDNLASFGLTRMQLGNVLKLFCIENNWSSLLLLVLWHVSGMKM